MPCPSLWLADTKRSMGWNRAARRDRGTAMVRWLSRSSSRASRRTAASAGPSPSTRNIASWPSSRDSASGPQQDVHAPVLGDAVHRAHDRDARGLGSGLRFLQGGQVRGDAVGDDLDAFALDVSGGHEGLAHGLAHRDDPRRLTEAEVQRLRHRLVHRQHAGPPRCAGPATSPARPGRGAGRAARRARTRGWPRSGRRGRAGCARRGGGRAP